MPKRAPLRSTLTPSPPPRRLRQKRMCRSGVGLPADSRRYWYRPPHQQPMFATCASPCPNAETLATSTYQRPVHPSLPAATVEWMAARIAIMARKGQAL